MIIQMEREQQGSCVSRGTRPIIDRIGQVATGGRGTDRLFYSVIVIYVHVSSSVEIISITSPGEIRTSCRPSSRAIGSRRTSPARLRSSSAYTPARWIFWSLEGDSRRCRSWAAGRWCRIPEEDGQKGYGSQGLTWCL